MRAPDLEGPFGRAWLVTGAELSAMILASGRKETPHASVAYWIVHAPGYHPWWENYVLACVHLREMEGVGAPIIHRPGVTHECILMALSPDWELGLDLYPIYLSPENFVGQWRAHDDDSAAEKIRESVNEILMGTLSPDTDYMRQWVERYSDSNLL